MASWMLILLMLVVVAGLTVCAWLVVELVRGRRALRRHQAKCDQDKARWTGETGPR